MPAGWLSSAQVVEGFGLALQMGPAGKSCFGDTELQELRWSKTIAVILLVGAGTAVLVSVGTHSVFAASLSTWS